MRNLLSIFILSFLSLSSFPTISAGEAHCYQDNTNTHSNPRKILLEKLAGEWLTHCIYSATELNIASLLESGPKSIDELATLTNTQSHLLYRLMNTLASNGIFHELQNKTFENNSISTLFSPNHPHSLYDIIIFYKDIISPNWSDLTKTLQSNTPAFEIHNDMPVFKYFKQNPQAASRFNAAMKSKSNSVIDSLLNSYDFSPYNTFYDIGSGKGHFAFAILNGYPNLSATLFDLPEVIESAKTTIPANLHPRCSHISGDFFSEIPKNGDVYFLKSIIHDWPDTDALKILKNCHQAMSNHSRLLILEPILLPPNTPDYAKSLDILMMAITGGRERSLEEMTNLLSQAGFKLINTFPTDTEFSILEFIKNNN